MLEGRARLAAVPGLPGVPGIGAGQERVYSLWLNDFTGVALPGAETTRTQVKFWFAGPDNATNLNSKSIIFATLDDVFDAIKSDDFDIDCEGGGGACAVGQRLRRLGRLRRQPVQQLLQQRLLRQQAGVDPHPRADPRLQRHRRLLLLPTDGSNQPWNAHRNGDPAGERRLLRAIHAGLLPALRRSSAINRTLVQPQARARLGGLAVARVIPDRTAVSAQCRVSRNSNPGARRPDDTCDERTIGEATLRGQSPRT